jgi:hypothetical protein
LFSDDLRGDLILVDCRAGFYRSAVDDQGSTNSSSDRSEFMRRRRQAGANGGDNPQNTKVKTDERKDPGYS